MVEKSAVRTSLKARARNVTSVFVATILAVGLISSASPAIAEELAPDATEVSEVVEEAQTTEAAEVAEEPQAAGAVETSLGETAVPMVEILGPGFGITAVTPVFDYPVEDDWALTFGCTWNVPAGSDKGDFFTMTLPEELSWASDQDFDLRTPDGSKVIAHGVITQGPPASVRFELTDYFDTNTMGASGSCEFTTNFNTDSEDTDVTVDFELGSTVTPIDIDVRDCPTECEALTTPKKGAWWVGSDQLNMSFNVLTPKTTIAGEDVTIYDTPSIPDAQGDGPDYVDAGYALTCNSVVVNMSFETNDDGGAVYPATDPTMRSGQWKNGVYTEKVGDVVQAPGSPGYVGGPMIDCAPDEMTVTWPDLPVGVAVTTSYNAVVTDPGRSSYVNDASVEMTGTETKEVRGTVKNNSPSGTGSGPNIHLEKWSNEGGRPTVVPATDCDQYVDTCFAGDYDIAPGAVLTPGVDTPIFFTISNTGDQDLYNIQVTDLVTEGPAIVGLSCNFSDLGGPSSGTTWLTEKPATSKEAFNPNEYFECTGTLPGLAAGTQHSDRATVTAKNMPGKDVNGGDIPETNVNDDDPWNGATPSIHLEKWNDEGAAPTLDGEDFAGDYDTAPGLLLSSVNPTEIRFTITNTGPQPLFNVEVSDKTDPATVGQIQGLTCDFTEVGGLDSGTTFAGPFAPGASFECIGSLPPLAPGSVHADTAKVTAEGPERTNTDGTKTPGVPVDDDDPWNGKVPPLGDDLVPEIHLEKWNDEDADPTLDDSDFAGDYDLAPGLIVEEGESMAINFTITNTGGQELYNVVVSDKTEDGTVGVIQDLSCDFSGLGGPATGTVFDGPFKVLDSFQCTGTLEGMPAGSVHSNTAKVEANGPPFIDEEGNESPGTPVSDDDPWNAVVPEEPPATEPPTPVTPETVPPAATVPPSTPIPGLPVTGGQLAGGGIASIVLLAAGTVLVLMRRRRTSSTS